LRDDPENPQLETVVGKGYRFKGHVSVNESPAFKDPAPLDGSKIAYRRARIWLIGLATALLIVGCPLDSVV